MIYGAALALTLLATTQEPVRCDRLGVEPTLPDDKALDAVAETGAGWISIRLGRGEDDAALAAAAERGLSIWCTLLSREGEGVEWIGEVVERHKERVKHWSLERSILGAKLDALRAAREAIRAADGKFVVCIPATEEGVRALRPMLTGGLADLADVVVYIAFTSAAEAQIAAARGAFDEAGRDPETWVLLSDVASGGKNNTRSQAAALVQGACEHLRRDRDVKRLFWYPLQDSEKNDADQPEPTKHDQKGGLIAETGTRRLAFEAMRRTAAKLEGGESLEYVEAYGAIGVTVYRVQHASGGWTYWAWAPTTKTKRSQLVLPYKQETTITDIKGETSKAAEHEKGRLIDLYNEPVMIEVPEGN